MDYETDDALPERPSIWKRLLLMLLCGVFYSVAEVVIFALVVVQFFFALLTDQPNQRLLLFGQSLATYIYQIIQYLNFCSDDMPFPFSAWPQGAPEDCAMPNSDQQGSRGPAPAELDEPAVEAAGDEKQGDDEKGA